MRLFASLSLACLIPLFAQQPPQQGGGGRTPPTPKNLKVLKVEPGQSVIPTMRSYTTALGVRCDFCHVQGDFASDENHKKDTARMMITMVQDINSKFRGNRERVTCYTCHRGEAEPKTAPPATAPAAAEGH